MNTIETQARNRFASRLRQQYRMFNVITQEKQAKIKAVMEEALDMFVTKFKSQLTKNVTFSEIKNKIYYPVYTACIKPFAVITEGMGIYRICFKLPNNISGWFV